MKGSISGKYLSLTSGEYLGKHYDKVTLLDNDYNKVTFGIDSTIINKFNDSMKGKTITVNGLFRSYSGQLKFKGNEVILTTV
jgi:hypothetical protein